MATITLKYDARNSLASRTIEFVLSMGIFTQAKEMQATQPKNTRTFEKSLSELRAGNTVQLKNIQNPLAEILK